MVYSTSKYLHNLIYDRFGLRVWAFFALAFAGCALLLILIIAAYNTFASPLSKACYNIVSQSCIDYRMDECLASERYTRDECILLVAGRQP